MNRRLTCVIIFTAFATALVYHSAITQEIKQISQQHHQLIIIGSGPAGLTAALYAGRAKLSPLVIEGNEAGGVLTTAPLIENWPGHEKIDGATLIKNLRTHAQNVGAQFFSGQVDTVSLDKPPFFIKTDDGHLFSADALIIATGMCPKKAHCPGEQEYWGRGVCSCALCDAPLYDKLPVAVIGGGMMALQNILWLGKYASKIIVINSTNTLNGPKKMLADVGQTNNLEIINNCTLHTITGDNEHVTSIRVLDTKTNITRDIACSGVFVSLGYEPCTNLFTGKLAINDEGKIIVDQLGRTTIAGVFAAGNAATIPHSQAVICSASGCIAAIEAEKFLGHKPRKKSLWSCQKS